MSKPMDNKSATEKRLDNQLTHIFFLWIGLVCCLVIIGLTALRDQAHELRMNEMASEIRELKRFESANTSEEVPPSGFFPGYTKLSPLDQISERVEKMENMVYGDVSELDMTAVDNLASDLMMLKESMAEYKAWREAND